MKHHLMVGTWTPPGAIFTFEFDDETIELKLLKRTEIPHDEPISWMALSHDKKQIYGASMKKWSSHTVRSPTDIQHNASHPIGGDPQAADTNTRTRAIFLLPAKKPPYHVYCNPFYEHAGYGNVFAVSESGALERNIQNYFYSDASAIHGMAFDASESFLYSADMWANRVWTHAKDHATGTLTTVGSVAAPAPHDMPRWVALHPSGAYLYAVLEHGNALAEYAIDAASHLPSYTGRRWPLVPPFVLARDPGLFRADVCALSASAATLFATARSNEPGVPGYVAAFALGDTGRVERQVLLQQTATSGGHSNAVVPCPWSDDWLALTDDEVGLLEMWRWDGTFLARVARCEIKEPGFGMNAVWWD